MFKSSVLRGRRGATLLLYTVMLTFLIIPVTGLSIDIARVFVAQGRLQAAVDAAALGTTRLLSTTANSSEIAGEFLKANYPTSYWSSTVPAITNVLVTTTSTSQTVKVTASMSLPLIFLGLLSHNGAYALAATGNHTVYPLQPCTLTYPTGSAPALSSVSFNESTVLFNWGPAYIYPHGKLIAYYTDEHAMLLGVYQVNVLTSDGTTALTIAFPGGPAGNGTTGTPYSQTLTAAGGTAPYTFSITSGTLPSGLSLNASTGVISGTPRTVVNANLTAMVTDSLGGTATANGTINITAGGPLTLHFPGGANGQVGVPYSQTLGAMGGTAPYTFSISAGTLPAGLILNASSGAITGEPTAVVTGPAGNITAKLVDSTGASTTAAGTIDTSAAGALTVSLPGGPTANPQVGTPYSSTLTATGGVQPYTFSISAGSLPAGLSLNSSTGAITGQPTTTGTVTLTARVVDSQSTSATSSGNMNVTTAGPLKIMFPGGPAANGTVGTAYSASLTGSGGVAPYTFSISVGTLPAGLTLNSSTGLISGTPTTPVSGPAANLTAKLVDHTGSSITTNGTITIAAAPPGPPGGGGTTKITTTTNYPFSTFNSSTLSASSWNTPLPVGTTALTGAQAGTDTATWNSTYGYIDNGRPLWPAVYITDITVNPTGNSGDWQQGGTMAVAPNAVYGTWKGATKTYDETTSPATVTTTLDADPTGNNWTGIPDTPSGGFPSSGSSYSTEIVWNVDSLGLRPGRVYRLQFMIHDGDQNQSGGDSGEGCAVAVY